MQAQETFSGVLVHGQKPSAVWLFLTPVFQSFQDTLSAWPPSILFGQGEPMILRGSG
jgi:hypothetical protein